MKGKGKENKTFSFLYIHTWSSFYLYDLLSKQQQKNILSIYVFVSFFV